MFFIFIDNQTTFTVYQNVEKFGFKVYNGNYAELPTYEVIIEPFNISSIGVYSCRLITIINNQIDVHDSNIWNASEHFIPTLKFTGKPENFSIGNPFLAQCEVDYFDADLYYKYKLLFIFFSLNDTLNSEKQPLTIAEFTGYKCMFFVLDIKIN